MEDHVGLLLSTQAVAVGPLPQLNMVFMNACRALNGGSALLSCGAAPKEKFWGVFAVGLTTNFSFLKPR